VFEQWSACKYMGLTYSGNDTWDRTLHKASSCWSDSLRTTAFVLTVLVQPSKFNSIGPSVLATISSPTFDAVGELDGTPCVLEWKTTSARYPEEPVGISALDPQLVSVHSLS